MSILRKILAFICMGAAGLVLLAFAAYWGLAASVTFAGDEKTPAGVKRNTAHYVTMRDGVDIAVDVWLPADYEAGEALPALMRATRYGRAHHIGTGLRFLKAIGKIKRDPNFRDDIRILNENGYAVVKVDARGSGASFGRRLAEWSRDEVADYGEIAEWITQQSWSNGRIGAYGVSYDGNAAEMIAVPGHPAVVAVAPQYSYFDPYNDLIFPGGVFDEWFIARWSAATNAMDYPPACTRGFLKCLWRAQITGGAKPVDAKDGVKRRDEAFANRNNPTVMESLENFRFRDDIYGQSGEIYDVVAPFHAADAIAESEVAMNVWTGWYDSGTVNGSLSRYNTLPNKQVLILGPYTHGGKFDTNPYAPADKPVEPDMDEQTRMLAAFFDPLLKEGKAPDSVEQEIRYFTLGEDVWKTTKVWPPAHIENARWFLGDNNLLADTPPEAEQSADDYAVDFSASSGPTNRWRTIGGPDVIYADRREEDKKLLTYTSAPIERDLEITGTPVITLNVASTHEDGALHVYLEDVSPDGRVQYLTEGVMRLSRRKERDRSEAPYVTQGPYHAHLRADAEPMIPGETAEVSFALYAISAVVKKGHSIRVAIAGADSAVFERVPAEGDPVITVEHGALSPSFIDLPQQWRDR